MLPAAGSAAAAANNAVFGDRYFTRAEYSGLSRYGGGVTIDNSLLYRYFMSPLCAWIVRQLPSWLAPNALTMFGWFCNFLMYVMVSPSLMELDGPYNASVNFTIALCILTYQIADNCDGKQSVRTGSSSHFGELLDHGVDSAVMSFQTLLIVGVVRGGAVWALVLGLLQQFLFYSFHWREMFEQNLELGRFNGPTEALAMQILLNLFTAGVGSEWWLQRLAFFGIDATYGSWLLGVAFAGSAATLLENVFYGTRRAVAQGFSFKAIVLPAVPALTTTVAAVVWLAADWQWFLLCTGDGGQGDETVATPAPADDKAFSSTLPVMYCGWRTHAWLLMLNAFFSYLSVSAMVQRMCSIQVRPWVWLTSPVIIGAVNSLLLGDAIASRETVLMFAFLFGSALALHFGQSVAESMCAFLGINFWTIPYPNKAS